MTDKQPHRNDPCPCGSGRKYKKCCLQNDHEAAAVFPPLPVGRQDSKSRFPVDPWPDAGDRPQTGLLDLLPEMADAHERFSSLEEAQRSVSEKTDRYNRTPQSDLGGLSPEQTFKLLGTPWDSPDFPLRFNRTSSLHFLEEHSPLFRNCRRFLELAVEGNGLERTQKGNLARKVVAELLDRLDIATDELDAIRSLNKVINEHDVKAVHWVRVVCQTSGMIYARKGKFRVSKEKAALLRPERAVELFAHLVQDYFTKFSMAYLDSYEAFASVQHTIAFTLVQLHRLPEEWHDYKETLPTLFLPSVMEEVKELEARPWGNVDSLFETRVFWHLVQWGFLACRYHKAKHRYLRRIAALRPTRLLHDGIQLLPGF